MRGLAVIAAVAGLFLLAPGGARAFNLFVLDPISKVFQACANKDREKLTKMSGLGSHAPSCARHS